MGGGANKHPGRLPWWLMYASAAYIMRQLFASGTGEEDGGAWEAAAHLLGFPGCLLG